MHFAVTGTSDMMEQMILGEIERLAVSADVAAFVRYSDCTLIHGSLEFVLIDPEIPGSPTELPIAFNFLA